LAPASNWNAKDPASLRVYWGWNEVPIPIDKARDMGNRQAVMIKLPAALCPGGMGGSDTIACLSYGAQQNLEDDLDSWTSLGMLKTGINNIKARPGSYIVFAREWGMEFTGRDGVDYNWQRYFYCENWTSPSKKYQIKFIPATQSSPGACYLDTCCSESTTFV